MNENFKKIGQAIINKKSEIAKEVHEERFSKIPAEEREKIASIEKEILEIRAGFIHIFGEALIDFQNKEHYLDVLTQWGKDTGERIYNMGAPLDEALKDTNQYRRGIWKEIKHQAQKYNMSLDTVFEAQEILDPLLDQAVYSFSLTYVTYHKETLDRAKSAFLELSVPVVPLITGVAVLPLIGNIDTQRARLIMEEALLQANKLKLTKLFIDLSGVAIVDTMVADRIFMVISALKLLGVKTILTGIRPEIAQTITQIGINFNQVEIRANLQQAIEEMKALV
ncbi:STAS domain-containing protein [Bacillus sp. Marseille-Q1617]|uniref:STAS domain-containing protein n=1 Tax=Bacillus sp. Marseille-Q1617 TaxID=2736887 RepID=UPI00158AD360|nr:STAS domain-containing protein [Bacillus sp. Marseille-Q1617]